MCWIEDWRLKMFMGLLPQIFNPKAPLVGESGWHMPTPNMYWDHTHIHSYIHTFIHSYIHAYIHTFIWTIHSDIICMCVWMSAWMYECIFAWSQSRLGEAFVILTPQPEEPLDWRFGARVPWTSSIFNLQSSTSQNFEISSKFWKLDLLSEFWISTYPHSLSVCATFIDTYMHTYLPTYIQTWRTNKNDVPIHTYTHIVIFPRLPRETVTIYIYIAVSCRLIAILQILWFTWFP